LWCLVRGRLLLPAFDAMTNSVRWGVDRFYTRVDLFVQSVEDRKTDCHHEDADKDTDYELSHISKKLSPGHVIPLLIGPSLHESCGRCRGPWEWPGGRTERG
jgi:hypothetical protein